MSAQQDLTNECASLKLKVKMKKAEFTILSTQRPYKCIMELLPDSVNEIHIPPDPNNYDLGLIEGKTILITTDNSEYKFVNTCERRGIKYGVILTGCENIDNYMGYLGSDNCIFIVRNYLQPLALAIAKRLGCEKKILTVRVQCSDIFYENIKSAANQERDINWFFYGELKLGRVDFLKAFLKIMPDGHLGFTKQGFEIDNNKTTALKTDEYINCLKRSKFAPCPMGWINIDTVRLYEALDAGAVPVVLSNLSGEHSHPCYWEELFGTNDIPFIIESNWHLAAQRCLDIIEDGSYEDLQNKCEIFWAKTNLDWKKKISTYFDMLKSARNDPPASHLSPIALSAERYLTLHTL